MNTIQPSHQSNAPTIKQQIDGEIAVGFVAPSEYTVPQTALRRLLDIIAEQAIRRTERSAS
jgi:hypothetical protein